MTLSERIKEQRKAAGLSQEKVAELMGVSRQAVTKWETGQSAPNTENLFRLAEIFGTTVDLLLTSEEKHPSPAEELYYLYKMEEEKKRLLFRAELKKRLAVFFLVLGGYFFIYLLGRMISVPKADRSILGWLFEDTRALPYLFGWLLHQGLYSFSALLSAVPALLGKRKMSFSMLAGFALSLPLGEYLGRYPKGEAVGMGHYGWLIWGIVFILSAVFGVLWEKNIISFKKRQKSD